MLSPNLTGPIGALYSVIFHQIILQIMVGELNRNTIHIEGEH